VNPVKARREERQLSITELARRAGLSREAVSRMEKGTGWAAGRGPQRTTVRALAQVLGCTERRLMEEIRSWIDEQKEVLS
jgi:transcriptional regulator with XRE-family HTH domain